MTLSLNVTVAAAAHETAEQLYAHIDISKLNWLEQQWVAWYLWIGNPILATGLMSFLFHEVSPLTRIYGFMDGTSLTVHSVMKLVYFGRCVPWIIIDAIPYFQKWKIQPDKIPTAKEQWECTKGVLSSHFAIELPAVCTSCLEVSASNLFSFQIWFFHPMADALGLEMHQVPFPPWRSMLPQIAFFFVFEDFFHFWGMVQLLRICVLGQSNRYYSSPGITHGCFVQAHSQTSSQVFCTFWFGCRVRPSSRDLYPWHRYYCRSFTLVLL